MAIFSEAGLSAGPTALSKLELRQYRAIDLELKQLEELIIRMRDRIEHPRTVLSHQPKSPNNSKAENVIIKMLELETIYQKKWNTLIDLQTRIEKAIEKLEGQDRVLMRAYYIEGKKWEQIADDMAYSVSHLWRVHSRVLKKMRVHDSSDCDNI